jgi:peptide/nickel transport system permease protein
MRATARGSWARFGRSPNGVVGLALLGGVVAGALLVALFDGHSPVGKDVAHGLSALGAPLPPSAAWPLGTDMLGRCVAARVAAGAALSLQVGTLAALGAVLLGTVIGAVAGWAGRRTDAALMRLVDLVLAFPFLLLVLTVAALLRERGTSAATIVLVLVAAGWTGAARVIRAKVLALRDREFITAARASGAGATRILVRHVLPNVLPAAVALAPPLLAQMIVVESALAYLGLGAGPPVASWGRMLAEGQSYLRGAPWLVTAPAAAILLTTLGFNLLGDGLRDALDPRG